MKRNGLHNLLRDLKKLNLSLEATIEKIEDVLKRDVAERESDEGELRFSDSELKAEWQRLQDQNGDSQGVEQVLKEFVSKKSKAELRAFIRANDLPIATKESRQKIALQLAQLLRVGATVRGH